ncbi:MAG: hypothetical protein GXY82_11345 [Methanospirillum sp.]|nr:hypothetical protein [Methanospirillum sp.]
MTTDEIERGFAALEERVREYCDEIEEASGEVRMDEAALLARMVTAAAAIVPAAGLEVMSRGKVDAAGGMYDTSYYPGKMLVLGRTDPVPFRPDNPDKAITDQFCVLREDGTLAELMYSNDTVLVDSLLEPISPGDALGVYGPELLFILYRGLLEHLEGQEALLDALRVTLEFIHG